MQPTPQEPKFIKNITWLQKVFASVAVSMFAMVWFMGLDFVIAIFKPDFVSLLTHLRVSLMLIAIILTAFVGYHQISTMLAWALDAYKVYQKFKESERDQ